MIASLPMYDPAHVQWANDDFWGAIRAALPFDAPETLSRPDEHWSLWEHPETLLTQVCSRPFVKELSGKVHGIAAPDYRLPECPPAHYNSVIVAREGVTSAKGARMAFNERRSQSGYFSSMGSGAVPSLETGAHANSLDAVLAGDADVAFIDAHTLDILGLPDTLHILGRTTPVPGPPFVTARAEWVAPLRKALETALATMDPEARTTLGIHCLVDLNMPAYAALASQSTANASA